MMNHLNKQARKGFRPPSAMKEIFWIVLGIFWEDFFGGIYLAEFFGRNFFGGFFWEDFFGGFFWRNSLGGIT